MIRYIIEKNVINDYATGATTLMGDDKPKTFVSPDEAMEWLIKNEKGFCDIPIMQIASHYNIKPYVI